MLVFLLRPTDFNVTKDGVSKQNKNKTVFYPILCVVNNQFTKETIVKKLLLKMILTKI